MKTFAIFLSITVACLADDPRIKVEFRRALDEAAPGFTQRQIEGTSRSVYVHDTADYTLTPDNIEEARAGTDDRMMPTIEITFTKQGGEKMSRLTEDSIGKLLAILVDGRVVSAPVVRSKISGAAIIQGDFTEDEVKQIVRSLQGG
jgi:preprotein translocase subunit SecD